MGHQKGFRITYASREYEGKDISKKDALTATREQLDQIRNELTRSWFLGSESYSGNNQRMQCVFDDSGNFVDFRLTKSMGQRYHADAAIFVSSSQEGLEKTVKGFNLHFDPIKVSPQAQELWE
jgi:hypothetical protein